MIQLLKKQKLIRQFKKNRLPITHHCAPYEIFSLYYDQIMRNVDYESWIDYVLKVRQKFAPSAFHMADLACGTGATMIPLLKEGFKVVGVDKSQTMLEKLTQKTSEVFPELETIRMDLTTLTLSQPVEFMYSLNDSFNYLLTINELYQTFIQIYHNILDDGIVLFDLSTELNIAKYFSDPIFESHKEFAFNWINDFDTTSKVLKSTLQFLNFQTNEVYQEIHMQRIHPLEDIITWGKQAGFKAVHTFKGFTFDEPDGNTLVYHIVMQK